jgi:hypothetical protein
VIRTEYSVQAIVTCTRPQTTILTEGLALPPCVDLRSFPNEIGSNLRTRYAGPISGGGLTHESAWPQNLPPVKLLYDLYHRLIETIYVLLETLYVK